MKGRSIFCTSLLLTFCFASCVCAGPKSQTTAKQQITETEHSLKDNIHVEESLVNGQERETIVIKIKNRTYRVPDERVSYRMDGHLYFYNDDDDRYGHEFDLSPNKRWLFVTRKGMHTIRVGYLYHRTNLTGFVPVHPGGLLFDEAALRFFIRFYGAPRPLQSEAKAINTRIIGFSHWDRDGQGMTFEMTVGITYPRKQRGTNIVGHYDFRKGTFQLIHKKDYFDKADR